MSETKLGKSDMAEEVKKNLDRWSVLGRFDSEDEHKHMGLLVLSSLSSSISSQFQKMTHNVVNRNGKLQIQGLILTLAN